MIQRDAAVPLQVAGTGEPGFINQDKLVANDEGLDAYASGTLFMGSDKYRADEESTDIDGLPPGEGTFLPCSFWLAQVYALQGRLDEAERLFQRLLGLRNDLGLLSEEYDVEAGRLVGNFPQAFTHLTLVDAALTLDEGWCRRAGKGAVDETRPGTGRIA